MNRPGALHKGNNRPRDVEVLTMGDELEPSNFPGLGPPVNIHSPASPRNVGNMGRPPSLLDKPGSLTIKQLDLSTISGLGGHLEAGGVIERALTKPGDAMPKVRALNHPAVLPHGSGESTL
eukprot:13264536-Alexandrium_andersonii.AAC.1